MSKKTKYWIYHIPGIKIGVSNNPDVRTKVQGFSEYEILEEHTNAKVVSEREMELQRQYGYPVDKIAYWKTLRWQKKGNKIVGKPEAIAKRVANTDYSNHKPPQSAYTPEAQSKRIANTDWKALQLKRVANYDWVAMGKKKKKPINQYDLEGNFIQQWDSATDAGLELCKKVIKKHGSDITACCKGRLKTAHKFIWKYAN
jgi:hypothetical protein